MPATTAKAYHERELAKVFEMRTFLNKTTVAEAKANGYRVIGTRFVMNKALEKARLVVQDVRRGKVEPEHWAPTPSTMGLRIALVVGQFAAARSDRCRYQFGVLVRQVG